jgi:exopolyphosphatase/guanosine-5'-triphosphate,3'-diphosphate pyrophosphatase
MRFATIDVGTNTAKMLLGTYEGGRTFEAVAESRRFVRLGEGVDALREIQPAAIERLVGALFGFSREIADFGAERILVGATSATRDAANRARVIQRVKEETGLEMTVISGIEEAQLSFAGAASLFPDLEGPVAVLDVGGGSSELVAAVVEPGRPPAEWLFCASLDVGSVRLTERCFTAQPPSAGEREAARDLVRQALAGCGAGPVPGLRLIGAAGTTGALARLHYDFGAWSEAPFFPLEIPEPDIAALRTRLAGLTYEDVLALNPDVLKGRADIIHAGVLIVHEVLSWLQTPVLRISSRGLRHGLALRLLGLA